MGPKKNFEVHFRVTDEEGERFSALCSRLGFDRSEGAREALSIILQIGEARPDLEGPRLHVFILEFVSRALVSPSVDERRQVASSRTRTDTKRHR